MKPQTNSSRPMLTDGGLETVLIFHHGQELPEFAAFPLLRDEDGRKFLRGYNRQYLDIAADLNTDFLLSSATWRSSTDWGTKIGYSESELRAANELSIQELLPLRDEYRDRIETIEISGNIGPRGDGYVASALMTAAESQSYHATQIQIFADQGADSIAAITLNYVNEAVGVIRACQSAGLPSVISFTVETDGCLPTGESLREAIERTDVETDGVAESFMINCAHPTHFENSFAEGGDWIQRIHGIRANASRLSHAELDGCEQLDEGDPADLADRLRRMKETLPRLRIFGGCCGTDHRHIRAIGDAVASSREGDPSFETQE